MNSNNRATLLFAGDFCSRPSAKQIKIDDGIKALISTSDIAVVNFETPLKPIGSEPVEKHFFQHHDSVEVLKDLGFSLFNVCNNHILDYGSRGVEETIKTIGSNLTMGIVGENTMSVYFREINGCRIAFIPLCYDSYATDSRNDYYVNSVSSSTLQDVIKEAKQEYDYVIVLPHDGIEYIPIPTPYIRKLYKLYVDWGADAVVATHPHCIQGMERYRNAPIIYSTGNLFFNSKATVDFKTNLHGWYNGMIVKLMLNHNKIEVEHYFTKNIGNKELLIDHSTEQVKYFKSLCDILVNSKEYESSVKQTMHKLLQSKYLPTVDSLFRMQIRSKNGCIYLLKQVYNAIRNRGYTTDYLKFILRSNTERNFFVESLNEML